MKKYFTITIAVMMFMAVVTITAEAQASGSHIMRARIPFTFNVGKTELPAGEYTITVLNPNSDRKVLQIRSADKKLSALIQTSELDTNTPEQTKLVFNRYGDKYFFAQAQTAGESTTLAAVKSSAERNEEHAVASKGGKTTIAILGN
ncbi:MAG TPA: hypothetical protein VJS13_06825 [Pyrinomonadaceae bacterium]|nr:hypothetical protein [Pyrinomonadaceae bacterium]